jgi:small subunit ribosomal protein S6
MNPYEVMFVLNGELSQDDCAQHVEKFKENVEKGNGKVLKIDEMGLRKLAYPIKKKNTGYYFLAYIEAGSELLEELKRLFRINEDVFRFIFIKLDPKNFKITEDKK